MRELPDPSEELGLYADLLKGLCGVCYPIAVTISVDADDTSPLENQDGKPLRQCGLLVSENDRWEGDITATVSLRDLKVADEIYGALSPLLMEPGYQLVDLLGQALLQSHLGDFEMFSTHIAFSAWKRACAASIHRHYGLTYVPGEDDKAGCLRFDLPSGDRYA
jgi:hypothetical protein